MIVSSATNKIVYILGTVVLLVAILAILASSASAQGGAAQDLTQANFTLVYTDSFSGGINPSTTTISYDSQNNTMISITTQLFDRFQPPVPVKTWQLTEEQEQKLRTMIMPVISNRYNINDNTCPTPSACQGFDLQVTIGNQTNKVSWTYLSAENIKQMDDIANEIVSSNTTK